MRLLSIHCFDRGRVVHRSVRGFLRMRPATRRKLAEEFRRLHALLTTPTETVREAERIEDLARQFGDGNTPASAKATPK